jgi:Protein of unknown function (DUF3179)
VLRRDDRLKPRTMILGLDVEGADRAFPLAALRKSQVINDELGGRPILVVHQPESDTITAFLARSSGKKLTFAAVNREATELTDAQTHSRWDAYGQCISGKLQGSHLEVLILGPEYWFAWSEFHPATSI